MDARAVKTGIPPLTDTCPPVLRKAVQSWQAGKLSGGDLVEASYYAMLDVLADYRRKASPTPPDDVRDYRALSWAERRKVSASDRDELLRRHQEWFQQEGAIHNRNETNRLRLQDLLEWAKTKSLSSKIVSSIEQALWSHRDEATQPAELLV